MDVGVRELKAKLSMYLDRASKGETLVVTDRGRPVATLGPPLGGIDLAAAAEAGWLTPAKRPGPLRPVPRVKAIRPTLDVLTEDRGE